MTLGDALLLAGLAVNCCTLIAILAFSVRLSWLVADLRERVAQLERKTSGTIHVTVGRTDGTAARVRIPAHSEDDPAAPERGTRDSGSVSEN